MPIFRITTYIEASVDEVWDVVASAERIPEWQGNVVDVRDVTGPLYETGASYTIETQIPGNRSSARWEVTLVERPYVLELHGTAPFGGPMRSRNSLSASGSGTEAVLELEYELPQSFLSRFIDRGLKGGVQESRAKLKSLVERERMERRAPPIR